MNDCDFFRSVDTRRTIQAHTAVLGLEGISTSARWNRKLIR